MLYIVACDEKQQHEAGLMLLKLALQREYRLTMEDENALGKKAHGKPFLKDYPNIAFNISNSRNLAVCAIAASDVTDAVTVQGAVEALGVSAFTNALNMDIGVDVELIRPATPALIRRFHPKEQAYIAAASNHDEAVMRIWTMKEAYLKMTGDGLTVPISSIVCVPGEPVSGATYRQLIWQNKYVITVMQKSICISSKIE